jgi:aryl-alcohol dehydrogenase-like predicted oxidoreductase
MPTTEWTRRGFIGAAAAGLMAAACSKKNGTASDPPKEPHPGAPQEGQTKLPPGGVMPMRQLGRTGARVSVLGLGGFHIGIPKEESESIRLIHAAIDHGVTFMDNCWDYNEGRSEERMGKALAGDKRGKVFLMSKIDGRTKDIAAQQIEQSLKRLRTDVIDLMQIHEVIRFNDPARVFGARGAIEALVAAKQAGKIRHIGFTGHKDPDIHLAMLAEAKKHGFTFDTVQMPVNAMDPHFKSFTNKVLPVLVQEGIGVLGMKSLGAGILLESGVVRARECLHYAMSQPTSVVITGCETMGVLEQALEAAMAFEKMDDTTMQGLLARTKQAGSAGKFEEFKTTDRFDGTAKNPKWLESASL